LHFCTFYLILENSSNSREKKMNDTQFKEMITKFVIKAMGRNDNPTIFDVPRHGWEWELFKTALDMYPRNISVEQRNYYGCVLKSSDKDAIVSFRCDFTNLILAAAKNIIDNVKSFRVDEYGNCRFNTYNSKLNFLGLVLFPKGMDVTHFQHEEDLDMDSNIVSNGFTTKLSRSQRIWKRVLYLVNIRSLCYDATNSHVVWMYRLVAGRWRRLFIYFKKKLFYKKLSVAKLIIQTTVFTGIPVKDALWKRLEQPYGSSHIDIGHKTRIELGNTKKRKAPTEENECNECKRAKYHMANCNNVFINSDNDDDDESSSSTCPSDVDSE